MKIIISLLILVNVLFSNQITIKDVVSVYDGDTFKVNLENCNIDILCNDIPVRVYGIDTPEKKGTTGDVHLKALEAQRVTEFFLKLGNVSLEECKRDKYFRILCKVKRGSQDLSEILIKKGLAKPYFGGTKEGF